MESEKLPALADHEQATLPPNNPLARLDRARSLLAECKSLPEIKKIRDIAEAARVYAKAAHMGLEAANHAAEIKLLAEAKAGDLLAQLKRDTKRDAANRKHALPNVSPASEYACVLRETETPPSTARYWQKVANVPEATREKYLEEIKASERLQVSTRGCLSFATDKHNKKPKIVPKKFIIDGFVAWVLIQLDGFLKEIPEQNLEETSSQLKEALRSWLTNL